MTQSDYFNTGQNRIDDGTTAAEGDINSVIDAVGAGFELLPDVDELNYNTTQYGVDSGAANAYAITLPHTPTSLTDAGLIVWKPANTNTSASVTADIGVGGAVNVMLQDGTAPYIGDLAADYFLSMRYNSTTMMFEIESITPSIVAAVAAASSASAGSGLLISANDTLLGYLNGKAIAGNANSIVAKTSDDTFVATDFIGMVFTENNDGGAETLTFAFGVKTITNTGASGAVNITLPAGVSGYEMEFEVTAAQYLKVTAVGSEVFTFKGADTAAAGYIRSNTVGTRWKIKFNGVKWTITNITGVLLYDQ